MSKQPFKLGERVTLASGEHAGRDAVVIHVYPSADMYAVRFGAYVDTLYGFEMVPELPPSGIPDVNSLAPRLPSPEYMAAWRAARDAGAR